MVGQAAPAPENSPRRGRYRGQSRHRHLRRLLCATPPQQRPRKKSYTPYPPKKPGPQCNHLPHCGKIIIFVPRAASRSPVWASGRGVNGLGEDRSKTLASARRLILDHTKCGNFLFSVKSEATADVCADVYFCDTHISGVGFCVARSTE